MYRCITNCPEMRDETTGVQHHCQWNSFESYISMLNQYGGGCYCGNIPRAIVEDEEDNNTITNKRYLETLSIEELAEFMVEHSRNKCVHCSNLYNWSCCSSNCLEGFSEWLKEEHCEG